MRGRRFAARDDADLEAKGSRTGLPPATRGKWRGFGQVLPFHLRTRAPGVPVRHTRKPQAGIGRPRSGRIFPVREFCPVRAAARGAPFGFCRESGSRAKTVERGAERCQFLPNPCGSFQRPDRFDRKFNATTGRNRPRGRKPVRRRKDGS
jgi:hypothetical protein